jgi:signal transduction histidine kinase
MDQIRYSIKTKLNLAIGFAVLFFLALLLGISYGLLKDSAIKGTEELTMTLLNGTDKQVDAFFSELERITRSVAEFPSVRQIEPDRMREEFLASVRYRKEMLRAIYLGTKDGEMYEWGYGPGFVDNAPVFPPDYDPRVRPWYAAALEADGYSITRPYLYASIDEMGITSVIPVYDYQDTFIGVLGVDVTLSDFQNIIEGIDVQKEGKVVLLNQDHEPIVDQFEPGVFDPQLVVQGNSGSFLHTFGENRYYVGYKQNERSGWTLLLAFPYSVIMERPMASLRLMIVFDILLMLLLFVVLGVIGNRLIIHPLLSIVRVMRSIESGNRESRVPIESSDEIAMLARELNALVDRVNDYSRAMEEKVEQRTRQIGRLQQENLRLRIIEEKERIYGYLHDSLGARLTNIFLSNSVAQNAENRELLSDMHERIEENARKAIDDLKEILSGSREPENRRIIDFQKLVADQLLERLQLFDIDFHCTIDHPEELNELSYEIRFELENILQELVSNVLKHSGARCVELAVNVDGGRVRVRFSDDGIGFDPEAAREHDAYGIHSMKNRVQSRGGLFILASKPGSGTSITIEMEAS